MRRAAIEVRLPNGISAPSIGRRLRVVGKVGRAYDAPRIVATVVTDLGAAPAPTPRSLGGAPSVAVEWRLVRVSGTIVDIHKLGDRWRAELRVGSARVVISGLAGAHIPATSLIEGRRATIVGIARRPYPGSADRRFAVVPRSSADVAVSSSGSTGATTGGERHERRRHRSIGRGRGPRAGRRGSGRVRAATDGAEWPHRPRRTAGPGRRSRRRAQRRRVHAR